MDNDLWNRLTNEEIDEDNARRLRRKRNDAFRRKLIIEDMEKSRHRHLLYSVCAAMLAWTYAGIQYLR
ncbi:hypothetical protein [Noviherbaspirillum saxi]|uniref:Uncharacterized protein n=1 Tax=Noviherbaspirillum saxi TaxID=2320863 RepID=A0A3A3G8D6_9BURK|nr:hypothetical protein [Noviherbaspirillum saxi]RJF97159.1 hypothetical protein D3871_00380 [Noviherbaspirillum saxi]